MSSEVQAKHSTVKETGESCCKQKDAAVNSVDLLLKAEVQAVDSTTRQTELQWQDMKGGERTGKGPVGGEGGSS